MIRSNNCVAPITLLFSIIAFANTAWAKSYNLQSPNGRIMSEIAVDDSIRFNLKSDSEIAVKDGVLALSFIDGKSWGVNSRIKGARKSSLKREIESPFYKKSKVHDEFNELCLTFREGFTVEFRMYNDGMAYRFVSLSEGRRFVKNEIARYTLNNDYNAYVPYVKDRKKKKNATKEQQFWNDMQNTYTYSKLTELDPKRLMFTPVLIELGSGKKLCLAEADVENYPGMYLNNETTTPALHGEFAPYPKRVEQGGHNQLELLVKERENFIAKVDGPRSFPWRSFLITDNDGDLVESDMVYRLAAPNRVGDISWVKPGKVAWDWWNCWGLYGVDFRAGVNTETYKYYIDFAAKNGVEYVILDEGWATKYKCDLFDIVPEIDLPHIVEYAKSKGVGIILWAGYLAMEKDLERVVKTYSEMGVKGFKIDFLNRDDQVMINFMYRVADVCAKYKMMVDFHGCCKPTGLQRTYPNVVNYEAVFGLEQLKWTKQGLDMVEYDVTLPYIRMVAGPMDYTQGAMRNSVKGGYFPNRENPMSQGTRCHQLAEYIVFESPLNMLCDSPSNYMREDECMSFISSIPTVWDNTMVLAGEVAEYIVIAREKDDVWYFGALTDWNAREIEVVLPPSCEGKRMEIFSDGINADRAAQDYNRTITNVPNDRRVTIKMAPGGGWSAKIID